MAAFLRVSILIAVVLTARAARCAQRSADGIALSDTFVISENESVIGAARQHRVGVDETLLDIARMHDLGVNELSELYPDIDMWLPPTDSALLLPSCWILPAARRAGIVINLPELRLYYYPRPDSVVATFPVGVGDEETATPVGSFRVTRKIRNPTWHIPPKLISKYGAREIPPGPRNPLGGYWIELSIPAYGIHGTNFPWSIGWLMTHGCIRLYPEDIEVLFSHVKIGTPVQIVYEPIKIGRMGSRIFLEVHRDIYQRVGSYRLLCTRMLAHLRLLSEVDHRKVRSALRRMDGMPVDVTDELRRQ
jgi:L,D-transpeptidase ErfK/SrfK